MRREVFFGLAAFLAGCLVGLVVGAVILFVLALLVGLPSQPRSLPPQEPPAQGAPAGPPAQVAPPAPPVQVAPPAQVAPLAVASFERVIWALPTQVEIRYPPDVGNGEPVVIFASLPPVQEGWQGQEVTTAIVATRSGSYMAIPVAAETEIGVQWWCVVRPGQVIPLERLNEPISWIEVHPVSGH